MIVDLPDTNTTQVNKALVDLRERHGAVALGRVLTLVVVTVEEHAEAAIAAANHASYEHPCRVIGVVAGRGRGESRLDAQIRVGGDAGASDVVLLHTYGDLTDHPASVIMPLLLPDAPVVAWWPVNAPKVPSRDPVGQLAQRRITDAAATRRPQEALEACRTGYSPGDTDFAWSRLTLWRAVLAAALDQEVDREVRSAVVVGGSDSPSADLMAAWLALTLDCPVERESPPDAEGLVGVGLRLDSGTIVLDRAPDEDVALLATPGRQEQVVALQHRLDRECLAEELRRLDPDEVYGDVLTDGLARLRAQQGRRGRRPVSREPGRSGRSSRSGRTATDASGARAATGARAGTGSRGTGGTRSGGTRTSSGTRSGGGSRAAARTQGAAASTAASSSGRRARGAAAARRADDARAEAAASAEPVPGAEPTSGPGAAGDASAEPRRRGRATP